MEVKKYKLGEIAKIFNGSTPSTKEADNYDGDIIWVTPKDLSDQKTKYFYRGERNITKKGFDSCSTQMIPANNILMSSRAPIGLFTINKVDCCTNQGFKNIVLDKSISDVDFMYYFLKYHVKEIEALGSGTTFKEVSKVSFEKYEIEIPDLRSQQKIAAILSSLDDKIILNRRINAKLEQMAKHLYDHWFVQFDFPNADGKPYKASGGKMVYNETLKREIPEGWELKKISDIADFEKNSVCPSENPNVEYKHFSIPSYDECGSYTLEKGTDILSDKFKVSESNILVSKLNPWTNRVIWGEDSENQICSTEFVVMNLKNNCEKGFLYTMVKQDYFIEYCNRGSTGTSHSHRRVNPDFMMKYCFAYNELVVQKFSIVSTKYALMCIRNLHEIRKLTTLRDRLLPLLMNGQVCVK